MTLEDLKDQLTRFCEYDSMAIEEADAEAAINDAYRVWARETQCFYATETVVPPASSGYPLGEVPVTLPTHASGEIKWFKALKVYYPSTSTDNELSDNDWWQSGRTLYLKNVTTDGTTSATIAGYTLPDRMTLDADVPLIDSEYHRYLAMEAYCLWADEFATSELAMVRQQRYQAIVAEARKRAKANSLHTYRDREPAVYTPTWKSLI